MPSQCVEGGSVGVAVQEKAASPTAPKKASTRKRSSAKKPKVVSSAKSKEASDAPKEVPAAKSTKSKAEGTPANAKAEGTPANAKAASQKKRTKPPKKQSHNVSIGRRGEEAAAQYLYKRGYSIEHRNWTCAAGEADIIARDENALVFVEVKTRCGSAKGLPEEAVDPKKRRRYENIAAMFLAQYDVVDVQVRFDIVSILVVAENRALIRHHINAFAAG